MIKSNRPLTCMSKNQFVMALSKIRYAVDGDILRLYGIEFVVDLSWKDTMAMELDPIILTTTDSQHCFTGDDAERGIMYEDVITHLRSGPRVGDGAAIWKSRELLLEALQSGECNIG